MLRLLIYFHNRYILTIPIIQFILFVLNEKENRSKRSIEHKNHWTNHSLTIVYCIAIHQVYVYINRPSSRDKWTESTNALNFDLDFCYSNVFYTLERPWLSSTRKIHPHIWTQFIWKKHGKYSHAFTTFIWWCCIHHMRLIDARIMWPTVEIFYEQYRLFGVCAYFFWLVYKQDL